MNRCIIIIIHKDMPKILLRVDFVGSKTTDFSICIKF